LTGETFSFNYVCVVTHLLAVFFCLLMELDQVRNASH